MEYIKINNCLYYGTELGMTQLINGEIIIDTIIDLTSKAATEKSTINFNIGANIMAYMQHLDQITVAIQGVINRMQSVYVICHAKFLTAPYCIINYFMKYGECQYEEAYQLLRKSFANINIPNHHEKFIKSHEKITVVG